MKLFRISIFGFRILFFCLVSAIALAGEYDSEISKVQKIIAKDPANIDAAYQLGNYLAWDGRYDEALAVFQEILTKDPSYEDADIGIARVYAWKGDQANATGKYLEIIARNPKNFEAYQGLGSLSLWANDYEKAVQYFAEALLLHPNDIVSLKGIGRAYLGRGDRRRAEQSFTKAQIQEIKKTRLPMVAGIAAGGSLLLFLIFILIRSRIRKRKGEFLRMELRVLRYALVLYQQKTGKFPLALEGLLDEKWRPPGSSEDRPYLEGARRGERGFLIDPFGKRYWYNPDTGGTYSTMKGCEKW